MLLRSTPSRMLHKLIRNPDIYVPASDSHARTTCSRAVRCGVFPTNQIIKQANASAHLFLQATSTNQTKPKNTTRQQTKTQDELTNEWRTSATCTGSRIITPLYIRTNLDHLKNVTYLSLLSLGVIFNIVPSYHIKGYKQQQAYIQPVDTHRFIAHSQYSVFYFSLHYIHSFIQSITQSD
jgi:hypothetical protein